MKNKTVRMMVVLGIFSTTLLGWQTVSAQSGSAADWALRDAMRNAGKASAEQVAAARAEWERHRAMQLKEFDAAYQKELSQREHLRAQMTERSTGQHSNTGLSAEKQASIRARLRALGLD